MRDSKRCCVCENVLPASLFRKNSGVCSLCLLTMNKIKTRIHNNIHHSIRYQMSSRIWKFLPYDMSQLRVHLENQFEFWMNWNNHGRYYKETWNNDNVLTWTWNIDHIIPQSNFLFTDLRDQNFIDCWSLENLRPLSAKENALKYIKESHEA